MVEGRSIACVDAAYGAASSTAACVLIDAWEQQIPSEVRTICVSGPPAEYEPGHFYRRELPLLVRVLEALGRPVGTVVIDGYVWLSSDRKPGLGAHLFEALGQNCPVIGVAKTRFRDDTWSTEVFRAGSQRPLLVTSVGITPSNAAAYIHKMHGAHRVPTVLKAVDHAARAVAAAGNAAV